MQALANKYKGKCEECGCWVPESKGFVCIENGNFVKQKSGRYTAVWCAKHVPTSEVMEIERRLMVKNGVCCCVTPYEPENLDLFERCRGARFRSMKDSANVLGVNYWEASLCEGDRSRLLEIADRLKLDVDEELRQVKKSIQAKHANSSGLYGFQVEGVDWLSKGDLRLLADDMGLGKTVECLMAIPKDGSTLVICPAGLKYNWEAECGKWRPDLSPVVIEGKGNFRWPTAGEVVIINYDILPKKFEPFKPEGAKPWEEVVRITLGEVKQAEKITVIVDEVHNCKNYKTARSKRVKGICKVAGKVWRLTGTPLENRPLDLWGMLDCVGMSRIVFGRFKQNQYGQKGFIEYMNGHSDGWGGYEFGTPEQIVPELMRRVMLRRRRHEVLPDLPSKSYHKIKVSLPKNLQTKMDRLWDEWGDVIDGQELPPFEEFSSIRAELAESRIPALIEMVADHEEQEVPLVVFSAHISPCKALEEREGWEVITGATPSKKRAEIVERFQAGELKGVATTIRAGGVGLTLTYAWKAIFVDRDWVPGWNCQAADRICRIGQLANCVEIVNLVSDHILDLHVDLLLDEKMRIIDSAIEKLMEVHPEEIPSYAETEYDDDGWPVPVEYEEIPF